MLFERKVARSFLLAQDRPTFLEIVYKAKVTPIQKQILYMDLLDDKDHRYIADELGLTETTVNHQIGKAYDLIYRYILNTVFVPNDNRIPTLMKP